MLVVGAELGMTGVLVSVRVLDGVYVGISVGVVEGVHNVGVAVAI